MRRHELVIPAGALSRHVRVVGTVPAGQVVSVAFPPEGLPFNPRHPPDLASDHISYHPPLQR